MEGRYLYFLFTTGSFIIDASEMKMGMVGVGGNYIGRSEKPF
jgi:hypothetical protein